MAFHFLAVRTVVGETILQIFLAVRTVVGENMLEVFLAVRAVVGEAFLEVFVSCPHGGRGNILEHNGVSLLKYQNVTSR